MFETGAGKAVQTSCLSHYRDPLQIARRSGHECLSAALMIGKPRFYVNISAAVPKRPPAPLWEDIRPVLASALRNTSIQLL
jgi:hypothetical protein